MLLRTSSACAVAVALVALSGCSKSESTPSAPSAKPSAAATPSPAPSAAPTSSAAGADALKAKLLGTWLVEMPRAKHQELTITADKVKQTVLPEAGKADDKAISREGPLVIVNEREFIMKASDGDKHFFFWDGDGKIHIHSLFAPVPFKDKAAFVIDDGANKIARDGDKCTQEDYEGKRPVKCSLEKRGDREVFAYGNGEEKVEYHIFDKLLVPGALLETKVTKK